VFGCAETKIDFIRIYFVKLTVVKSELNVKWFMFGYIHINASSTINLSVKKSHLESKVTNPNWVRINSWGKINFNQCHLNTSKSIFVLRITFRYPYDVHGYKNHNWWKPKLPVVYGTLDPPKQMIPKLKSENYLARFTNKNPKFIRE